VLQTEGVVYFLAAVKNSLRLKRINEAGGNAKYTEIPGFGHDIWNEVYGDQDLYNWMLAQRRVASTATGAR